VKIAVDQLTAHLDRTLLPVYLLTGDEPLQMGEACDTIRQHAKQAGFTDREIFHVEAGHDYSTLYGALDSYSLFGESRFIEMRFKSKPDKLAIKAILHAIETPQENLLLLVSLPKLSSAEQKSSWYQAADKLGAIITIWPLEGDRLIHWLDRRLSSRGLLADTTGLKLIAGRVEGNLLAAAQEIEKLSILYGKGRLTDDQIISAVADSARYDVFDLTNEVLRGHIAKSYRILSGLKGEGVASAVVLWALTRELRLLNTLKKSLEQGAREDTVFAQNRIWDSRKPIVASALRRLNIRAIQDSLIESAKVDRIVKGMQSGHEWSALWSLCQMIIRPEQDTPPSKQSIQ